MVGNTYINGPVERFAVPSAIQKTTVSSYSRFLKVYQNCEEFRYTRHVSVYVGERNVARLVSGACSLLYRSRTAGAVSSRCFASRHVQGFPLPGQNDVFSGVHGRRIVDGLVWIASVQGSICGRRSREKYKGKNTPITIHVKSENVQRQGRRNVALAKRSETTGINSWRPLSWLAASMQTASFPCQLAGPLVWTKCEPFHLTTARDSVAAASTACSLNGPAC